MNKILTMLILLASLSNAYTQDYLFYALSTSGDNAEPVYQCRLHGETGEITIMNKYAGVVQGNYFALSPDMNSLLVTSRNSAKNQGGLVHYNVTAEGNLTYVASRLKPGGVPSYVSFTPDGKYVLSSHYGDDQISLYQFSNNVLSAEIDNIVKADTAKGHYIKTDPSGKFVHAVFLGLDKIFNYTIANDKFVENSNQPSFSLPAGFGPRHMDFHPKKDFVYILNELNSSVTACSYNPETGVLTEIQNISMLPSGYIGTNTAAAIRIHPNGQFLYASNRGHNSIALYSIADNGILTFVEHTTSGINTPRDFNLSPDGKMMVVANLQGDSMMSFKINQSTGKLSYTGYTVTILRPLAIEFLPSYNNPSSTVIPASSNKKDLFNIYPNPTAGSITLSMDYDFEDFNFTLHNSFGEIIRNLFPDSKGSSDLSSLPAGLYFVKGCSLGIKGIEQLTKALLIIRN
jgi:6-phosphogluconolactonase